ncbi:MAG: hypothetical protein OEZ43_04715 [Gammaproteobacteria bacterium]|nr:hypothetical protein [Gammaproteobacteria bacterium]
MSRQSSPWGKHTRQRIAVEAARIMSQDSISDFETARRKAADRLGIKQRRDLPNNQEIEQELLAYRAMFSSNEPSSDLQKLRKTALEGMSFLAPFNPRLVGSVLDGTAAAYDAVQLHVFAENPDDIVHFLMEKNIDFDQRSGKVRYRSGKIREVPCLRFEAGETTVELYVFALVDIRHPPLSNTDGQTMKRADANKVKTLLAG